MDSVAASEAVDPGSTPGACTISIGGDYSQFLAGVDA